MGERKDQISSAKFLRHVEEQADAQPLLKIPEPLAAALQICALDWPDPNSQLLFRLIRALSGTDEKFSQADLEFLRGETLSLAVSLLDSAVSGIYSQEEWDGAVQHCYELR